MARTAATVKGNDAGSMAVGGTGGNAKRRRIRRMTSEDTDSPEQTRNPTVPQSLRTHTFDECRAHAGKCSLRHELLRQRYLLKDRGGRTVETPLQMFARVADAIAAAEATYGATKSEIRAVAKEFRRLMVQGAFLPNSPTLMQAGRKKGMLSACFVLPVADRVDGIFDAVKQAALVQKAGGGTGFSFDSLRPTGDIVASSGGRTSGPISFMKVFAEATTAIQQGAFRRGANMGMMSIDHPDILKFITMKNQAGVLENFNLSVKVTDEFMRAMSDRPNEPHMVINPRTGERYLIPRDVDMATYTLGDLVLPGHVPCPCFTIRDIWQMIVRGAYARGEPGVCFVDTVNRDNPTPHLGRIEATNPCGEQPLLAFESCNLASVDVSKFVDRQHGDVSWDSQASTIKTAVRFLDDVIDVNHYPIPEIGETTLGNRKIGLGIMGFADALLLMGIRYDSDNAVKFAEKVSRFLTDTAHEASEELARTRGTFPNWEGSIWDTQYHRPMRNAACTTIAPTGSISLIAGCSSGIEPVFSFVTNRRAFGDKEFLETHPLVERLGKQEGWLDKRVAAALLEGVPPGEIPGFPEQLAEVLITACEVAPRWHVRVQAAFQKHIDSAVSKTVNLPADASPEDVDKVFRLAYELGCKGITVYREGSYEDQALSGPGAASGQAETIKRRIPRPRARVTTGRTLKFRMGCGELFVTVNHDQHGPCEVFASLDKAGVCPSQAQATCRAVSAALRSGVAPEVMVKQLKGIRCMPASVARRPEHDQDCLSCPDAIARSIEEAMAESSDRISSSEEKNRRDRGQDPRRQAGCLACQSC